MREAVCALLSEAASSRVDPEERRVLLNAKAQLESGIKLDAVVASLPHLRYAKGLLMALGWAAEAEEAKDPAWQREAREECDRFSNWYRETLHPQE